MRRRLRSIRVMQPSHSVFFLGAATVLAVANLAAQDSREIARLFGSAVALGEAADFAEPLSLNQFSDGSILVLDWQRHDISRLSPDGRLLWRTGRKGGGPGEFQYPTRAVIISDQSVLVFDVGKRGVARFSSDGKYLGELYPDIQVSFNNAVALPSGEVAVLGYTRDPRGRDAAVHLLNSRLQHLRSFAPLADASDPRVSESFGAGGLTLQVDGTIVHTRMYPYEVRRYTRDGQLLSTTHIQVQVGKPEDYVQVSHTSGRMTTRINQEVTRPIPVRILADGRILGGRFVQRVAHLDLIDSRGRLLSSMPRPSDWGAISIVDEQRKVFWILGTKNDVPVLWRTSFGPAMP